MGFDAFPVGFGFGAIIPHCASFISYVMGMHILCHHILEACNLFYLILVFMELLLRDYFMSQKRF